MKKDYETMTVGEIVADNFGNAEVFDKYGIDFCCHGSILLPEASQKAGADMDEIIKDITATSARTDRRYRNCSTKYVRYMAKIILHYTMCKCCSGNRFPISTNTSTRKSWYCFHTSTKW